MKEFKHYRPDYLSITVQIIKGVALGTRNFLFYNESMTSYALTYALPFHLNALIIATKSFICYKYSINRVGIDGDS